LERRLDETGFDAELGRDSGRRSAPMTLTKARNVLVVDDEALIAMLIEDMLSDLGCQVVGPAYALNEALALAREAEIDCAILDLNLDGATTLPVADVLRERNIPFAFASGYADLDLAAKFKDAPVLQKPFNASDLAALMQTFAMI
jgi:CheY-like chemotaxis protein